MKKLTGPSLSPAWKRFLAVIVVLHGAAGVFWCYDSFQKPGLYQKDFISGYLMAKAILSGVNPYTPLHELAQRWISGAEFTQLTHPTPHPPMVGFLCLPLGLLSYEKAAALWFIFELLCLLVSICILLRSLGVKLKPKIVASILFFAIGWTPVVQDLWYGQLNPVLLVLFLGAWRSLRSKRDIAGGAFLGALIAFKLAGWPIVLFLAFRRRWSGVLAAVAAALACNLGAAAVLGLNVIRDYYFKVGPAVSAIYRAYEYNISLWTFGSRLFLEFGRKCTTLPLWSSPTLASFLTYFVPVLFLGVCFRLALRAKRFDTSFGVLVIAGMLINPVVWIHYLLLATIPIVIVGRRIVRMEPNPKLISALLLFAGLISASPGVVISAAELFATRTNANGYVITSIWLEGLTLLPVLGAIGVLTALWKTDGPNATQPDQMVRDQVWGEMVGDPLRSRAT
jgi:hypothetical protein